MRLSVADTGSCPWFSLASVFISFQIRKLLIIPFNESISKIPIVLILWTDAASRRFKFHKRRQFFIRTHNEPLSVAMRVSNKDWLPVGIDR
jgi:hypothetical protein